MDYRERHHEKPLSTYIPWKGGGEVACWFGAEASFFVFDNTTGSGQENCVAVGLSPKPVWLRRDGSIGRGNTRALCESDLKRSLEPHLYWQ